MGRFAQEDQIFSLMPFDMRRPEQVAADGQGGVTRRTFDYLVESVETEILVRLETAGVPVNLYTHGLIRDAANLLVAAQISRKNKAYLDTANSYFADANVKLRLFFDNVAGYSEVYPSGGEVVLTSEDLFTDNDLADSGIGLSVFQKVKV